MVIQIGLPILYRSGHLGPDRSTYGRVHSVKGRTSAPIGLHMNIGEDGLTKGWVCRVAEKNGDWLGSQDWAPHQGSVDGSARPVVQQGFDLSWVQVTTSAECIKSIKILPVPGRSCERGRKGAHRSSNQPVKTDGHSSFE
jgi:hypothetical protein